MKNRIGDRLRKPPEVKKAESKSQIAEEKIERKISNESNGHVKNSSAKESSETKEEKVTYQLSKAELENLDEYQLPAKDLTRFAREGRDRDGRTALMLMLEWKCVKAFVNSFEAEEFVPIVQSVRKLLKAGVDPAERDRESKTAAHYLAEWKYLKEKVDVSEPRSRVFRRRQSFRSFEHFFSQFRTRKTLNCRKERANCWRKLDTRNAKTEKFITRSRPVCSTTSTKMETLFFTHSCAQIFEVGIQD